MTQKKIQILCLIICSLDFSTRLFAQEDATVVVITNVEAKILVDGIDKGMTSPGSAFRIMTPPGEHYVEAQTILRGVIQSKGEMVQLASGTPKMIQLSFEVSVDIKTIEPILIAEINFNLPASLEVLAWKTSNPGKDFNYPSYYYAFEKGDEIILDVNMSNQKGTNAITVTTYPDNVVQYTNNAFVAVQDIVIKVPKRTIYRFTFASNHAVTRNCYLKIRRRPHSQETSVFNPNVSLQKILTPVSIAEPQSFFVNSGSNAFFVGGKSRVLIPVTLPENTVEWFYRFSASRNSDETEKVKANFGLFKEISSLAFNLSGAGLLAGNIAVESLMQPPGADFCDIVLLPYEFGQAYESKADDQWRFYQEGSRSNFKSGNVKVTCCLAGAYFLGIKNPSSSYGVNVAVEVVAITAKYDYVMEAEH